MPLPKTWGSTMHDIVHTYKKACSVAHGIHKRINVLGHHSPTQCYTKNQHLTKKLKTSHGCRVLHNLNSDLVEPVINHALVWVLLSCFFFFVFFFPWLLVIGIISVLSEKSRLGIWLFGMGTFLQIPFSVSRRSLFWKTRPPLSINKVGHWKEKLTEVTRTGNDIIN